MSRHTTGASTKSRRDYRRGHFNPRWVCKEPGCAESGEVPPGTPPASVADALLSGFEEHHAAAHGDQP